MNASGAGYCARIFYYAGRRCECLWSPDRATWVIRIHETAHHDSRVLHACTCQSRGVLARHAEQAIIGLNTGSVLPNGGRLYPVGVPS
jgi:hypothetical protein